MPAKFKSKGTSKSASSDNPDRKITKGGQRSKSTIARLKVRQLHVVRVLCVQGERI